MSPTPVQSCGGRYSFTETEIQFYFIFFDLNEKWILLIFVVVFSVYIFCKKYSIL